ncbi:MAG: RNA methyltransferase [Endomicrobium sp.]|jgi:TrmH family RNA methyltransferase|uniref:TrmH family RNA methyltransferase n=1 Tax=Candidatus Endomicrobiellum cubanum TaxID=3242325 RepID=UPI0028341EFF|nr:RNA methyltransferase [Endomicrobium sp.]
MIITSTQNSIFKQILKLQDKKFRDKNNCFFIEGKKQIEEIPKDWNIKQILISEKHKNSINNFKNVTSLSEHLFNKLSTTKSSQGIITIVEKRHYKIEDIIKNIGMFIILENIQDPGNLGTIIRSAAAFDAKAVFVSKGSVDIYSDKTLRSTMGSIFHIPVLDNIDIKNILAVMKKEKITVFAASLNGEKYLNNIKVPKKCAFIIGNESNGITNETENLADELIKINIPGKCESLNAAIASSIIMYEITKDYGHSLFYNKK